MPRKLRKRRPKHRARSSPQPVAVKEVGQRTQPLPSSSKGAPAAKPAIPTAEQVARHRYALSDLRRSLVIGGFVLLLLFVLYFLLR